MNGLTNAALSILLSWLRALMNGLWNLINTGGGTFVAFLGAQWKLILLVLCVGGTIIDVAVYVFRWRPYYVWRTKMSRRSRAAKRKPDPEALQQAAYEQAATETAPAAPVEPYEAYPEPTLRRAAQQPVSTPEPAAYASRSPASFAPPRPAMPVAPASAPTARITARPSFVDAPPEVPAITPDVVFAVDPTFAPIGRAPASAPDFAPLSASPTTRPQPMSDAYLRDVQTGFAPPPTPQELYRKRAEPIVGEPVHPGLDTKTLQQTIGLADAPLASRRAPTPPPQRSFAPYANLARPSDAARRKGGMDALRQKARSFVGVSDEEHPPSIRDLQPTVNVADAYHAPVFPKREDEED